MWRARAFPLAGSFVDPHRTFEPFKRYLPRLLTSEGFRDLTGAIDEPFNHCARGTVFQRKDRNRPWTRGHINGQDFQRGLSPWPRNSDFGTAVTNRPRAGALHQDPSNRSPGRTSDLPNLAPWKPQRRAYEPRCQARGQNPTLAHELLLSGLIMRPKNVFPRQHNFRKATGRLRDTGNRRDLPPFRAFLAAVARLFDPHNTGRSDAVFALIGVLSLGACVTTDDQGDGRPRVCEGRWMH